MFIKFNETRILRRQGKTLRFATGEVYKHHPDLQEFVDIGHAVECNEDGSPIEPEKVEPVATVKSLPEDETQQTALEHPALAADPEPEKKKPGRPPRQAPFLADDTRRNIEVADVPAPKRDPAKNGGMTEV